MCWMLCFCVCNVPFPVYSMAELGAAANCTRVWKSRTEAVTTVHLMSGSYCSPLRDQFSNLLLWFLFVIKVLKRVHMHVALHIMVLAEATEPILLVACRRLWWLSCHGDHPITVDTWMHVLVQWLCSQSCPRATDWAPWYPPQSSCTAESMMDSSTFSSSPHGAQHLSQLFCHCISPDVDAWNNAMAGQWRL